MGKEIKSSVLLPDGSKETIVTSRNGSFRSQGVTPPANPDEVDLKLTSPNEGDLVIQSVTPKEGGRGEGVKLGKNGEVIARIFDRPKPLFAQTNHALRRKIFEQHNPGSKSEDGESPSR